MLRRVLRDPGYVPSVGDDGFGTIFFHSVVRFKGSPSAEVANCWDHATQTSRAFERSQTHTSLTRPGILMKGALGITSGSCHSLVCNSVTLAMFGQLCPEYLTAFSQAYLRIPSLRRDIPTYKRTCIYSVLVNNPTLKR